MRNFRPITLVGLLLITLTLGAQTKLPPGHSDRSATLDVLPGFINPPKGFGDVPFYWWQGDTITKERLAWQLDQLSNKGISSLQINYSHQDSGGISYGSSNPSKPALFSEAWWKLFNWFAAEAQKKGMTVSLSDYTLGIGQGYAMDEGIAKNPELNGSQLKKQIQKLSGKGSLKLPDHLLNLSAFKLNAEDSLILESRKNLLPEVSNGSIAYNFGKEKWKIVAVYSEQLIPSYDPMHPQSGQLYNHFFFDKFDAALKKSGSGGLNFFFSDELNFRVGGNLWNKYFADEFKKRKGYDVVPYLDALYVNIGSITPKIKLDYNDVIVGLSEDNFFKPVYQWHEDRGLIFGCDHGGRGKDLAEFGDYFRTQRWNQGPGSDQPGLSKDIVKAKVASSIAHLYDRPRVWLEGFYGSGWGTTSSDVTEAIFGNFVAGYNLLSFHGLYYSTQGGWWEWAPPCNHFRMPYWKQIDPLMNCVQRLAYLLSQGRHNCDVAIVYPTEPVIAQMDGKKSVDIAFEAGERMYDKGIDFDFIDFESIARATVNSKELQVSGEKYKVLVVPSMKAIRFASLKKLDEFKKGGGLIVNLGNVPEATEKNGAADAEVAKLVANVFSAAPNYIQCDDPKLVSAAIEGKYEPNFKLLTPAKDRPYVMRRVIGKREVYAVYNVEKGAKCFFKAKGNAQLWNPWNGETSSLGKLAVQTAEGTEITMPLTNKEIQLVIFDSNPTAAKNSISPEEILSSTDIGNTWNFELKPSLDNQWGDFQLPAKKEMLGAQVRQLNFTEKTNYSGGNIAIDTLWEEKTIAFGQQFLKLPVLAQAPTEAELLKIAAAGATENPTLSNQIHKWETYGFSWKQGVEGDPGHQGYHGLKGKMYDNFIRMGALKMVKMSRKRLPEENGHFYLLYTNILAPEDGNYDLLSGEQKPVKLILNQSSIDPTSHSVALKKGSNSLVILYDKECETYLLCRKPGVPRPEKVQVAMGWFNDLGVLPFDCSVNPKAHGLFAFESAPALRSFSFAAYGRVAAWVDGIYVPLAPGKAEADGLINYSATLNTLKQTTSRVVIKVVYQPGYAGAAALPNFIEQKCGKGIIGLGDWSKIEGLKAYSGGAYYRKTITVAAEALKNKIELDLGDLVSSAELFINGKSAGIKVSPPWKFDISNFAKTGENKIEVLLYNTVANNYTTVPTMYRGLITSGLLGPVRLNILKK